MSTAQCDVAILGSDTRLAAPTSLSLYSYCITIFLSAFLLFQVQLLVGKYFLPWFGGTPAMWTTCMFFFQTLLLVGYLYSHWVATRLPLSSQGKLHLTVLLSALVCLSITAVVWHFPLMPSAYWKPQGP